MNKDTKHYEQLLLGRIDFKGKTVENSQGMGRPVLRLPTRGTLEAVVSLLDDPDVTVRIQAGNLIALYLQAASGSRSLDSEPLGIRAYFNAIGLSKAYAMLTDDSAEVRSAAAFILGNTLYTRYTERLLVSAFESEASQSVKVHLNWAYWKLGNNYDKAKWYIDNAELHANPEN